MEISALSEQFVPAKLPLWFTEIGVPTSYPVSIAIVAPTTDPQTGDWKTAVWQTGGPPYIATLLVGPGSSFGALAKGNYRVWIKVSPVSAFETPAMRVDWLRVT